MNMQALRDLGDRLLAEGRQADAGLVILAADSLDRIRAVAETLALTLEEIRRLTK